jgi:polyphosphate kinase
MMLILRREGRQLSYYTHLGTGNYHSKTARLYTDYSLFSSDKELGEDVRKVFVQLTSLGKMSRLDKLLQSPFTLHTTLIKKIGRETDHAKKGLPAKIIIKVNSVNEPQLIRALYSASMAGVKIVLIVRGICCLRPGIPGVSDNIQVRSVIGRFLEHSRVFWFENGGEPEVFCASADFMKRNMFRRVESCFPLENKKHAERVRAELDIYLKDNTHAWLLQTDGTYVRATPKPDEAAINAQTALLEQLAEGN